MKTLVAVVTLIQFFAASVLGSCIVSWREMNCDFTIPVACSQAEESPVRTCCGSQPVCPLEKPNPCQDKTRVVWSIMLSLDPSIVPCCAHVSLAPELTEFCDGHRTIDHSPDIIMTEPALNNTAVQQSDVLSCNSRPQGVHPTISTTVLRC